RFVGTTACYWTGGEPNRHGGPTGTSYSAAMVSAAAAIVFGARPDLQPGQAARLLEATALPLARDPLHQGGAGVVSVERALSRLASGDVPPADYAEPNEPPARPARLRLGSTVRATVDWADDPADEYLLPAPGTGTLTVRTNGAAAGAVQIRRGGRILAAGRLG